MKRCFAVLCVALLAAAALAQSAPAPAAKPQAPAGLSLASVLTQMDSAAAAFKNAQADFVWDQFSRVVNETDTQKGTIYFQRKGKNTEMSASITEPQQKYVLFTGSTVQVYQPGIDQLTRYDTAQNRGTVESFLILGFGGRGHDLPLSFGVKLEGSETVDGVRAARLELVPTSAKARDIFNRILLWIDLARGVSVQQQFFEPSGDYRLVRYRNIRINQPLPPDVFKLKTTGKTKVVTPQT